MRWERNELSAVTAATAVPVIAHDPRTRMLLEAPIVWTLLKLALPNVLVMLAQASIGLIETYFVGKLGVEALVGDQLARRQRKTHAAVVHRGAV